MRRRQLPAGAGDGVPRTQHIDNVAHHFLSASGEPAPAGPAASWLEVAVAAAGSGRAAACAAAGLAAAVSANGDGWCSCLVEDADVAWSSFSYLAKAELVDAPASLREDLPSEVKARLLLPRTGPPTGAASPIGLRWRLLGAASEIAVADWGVVSGLPAAARSAAPRWSALVWCATAGDAASPEWGRRLERLLTILIPSRVEFLVVPDSWDTRPGARRFGEPRGSRGPRGWCNPAHLQEIVRSAAGSIPARVRVFPDVAAAAGARLLAEMAADIAGSLHRQEHR